MFKQVRLRLALSTIGMKTSPYVELVFFALMLAGMIARYVTKAIEGEGTLGDHPKPASRGHLKSGQLKP